MALWQSISMRQPLKTTFEDKDVIEDAIADYNKDKDEMSQIQYTDYVGLMMSSVTKIINSILFKTYIHRSVEAAKAVEVGCMIPATSKLGMEYSALAEEVLQHDVQR